MIDPKHPDRKTCPMMLSRGSPEEIGGCIGQACAAFRWVVLDTETGSYWMTVTYSTELAAKTEADTQNDTRDVSERPCLEVMGVCGMVSHL